MNGIETELELATPDATAQALSALRAIDPSGMLNVAFETPRQIVDAIAKGKSFHEGDIPLDRSKFHLVGLGGSAIAGELLRDMVAPKRGISIHRGTRPPRDRAGVIVSSYSGNTREILELSHQVTGGLRTVVFFSSGGMLERLGFEWGIPLWKMPSGYQPRAAVGWSLALVTSISERWGVHQNVVEHLASAAQKLGDDLAHGELHEHPLVRCALPIAEAIGDQPVVIFHSLRCTGAARRLAAQINENAKQAAFAWVMPEAVHNGVEGLVGSGDVNRYRLIFMSDANDTQSLRDTMNRTHRFFASKGFTTRLFPSAGENPFELTLSRVLIADLVSLFLAAHRGIDPTPIPAISEMKGMEPPLDLEHFDKDFAEFR